MIVDANDWHQQSFFTVGGGFHAAPGLPAPKYNIYLLPTLMYLICTTLRQCSVGNIYNYKDMESSLLFNTKLELHNYFFNEYGIEMEL